MAIGAVIAGAVVVGIRVLRPEVFYPTQVSSMEASVSRGSAPT
jgi:hypothetical protein